MEEFLRNHLWQSVYIVIIISAGIVITWWLACRYSGFICHLVFNLFLSAAKGCNKEEEDEVPSVLISDLNDPIPFEKTIETEPERKRAFARRTSFRAIIPLLSLNGRYYLAPKPPSDKLGEGAEIVVRNVYIIGLTQAA